jgi:putative hydrolase of HD superfamily
MKILPRSGWLSCGVTAWDVESIADHSFSVSVLSLLIADLEVKRGVNVNVEKVLRMAILHDMSESLTFDISKAYLRYLGKRGEEVKRELEDSAWSTLVQDLKNLQLADEYARVQSDYNANSTFESKIVHAADGLDILLQVINFEQRGYVQSSLAELWKSTVAGLRRSEVPSTGKILEVILRAGRSGRRRVIR